VKAGAFYGSLSCPGSHSVSKNNSYFSEKSFLNWNRPEETTSAKSKEEEEEKGTTNNKNYCCYYYYYYYY
jgi:hypothetical protein